MNAKELPARPSLEQYKKQAKDLVKAYEAGGSDAMQRVRKSHPHAVKLLDSEVLKAKFALADAQIIIAREHGFESWPKFAARVAALERERSASGASNPQDEFLEAASAPLSAHQSGTLEQAAAILAAHPEVARGNIYSAAVLGDDAAVRRFLAADARSATAKGGPRGWDALTYLCFSRYLRLDKKKADNFLRAAQALLDAGADARTGYFDKDHRPEPTFESAFYGAAGVARHAGLTRLMLDCGADPNDGEVPYHAPESYDNEIVKILVESGKLTPDSLATMLLRKHDWHDYEGIKWLLEHGADPNRRTQWHRAALHQAALRDNSREIFEVLLDHGADPTLVAEGKSAVAIAARRGRGDLLELFERRGVPMELEGADKLLAACARDDAASVRQIAASEPHLVEEILSEGGKFLATFAGVGNREGVRQLLNLGVNVAALYKEGDVYWDLAKDTTALHSAAWRARHSTVKLLIERGAPVNAQDGKGRTPLALAVKACVDSYWTHLRSPESVEALLRAGASVAGVDFPSGYAEVDALLRAHAKKRD